MLKLLIADHDEVYSRTLAASLGSAYQVILCSSGPDALEILRSDRPQIMILDILLPGIDGISLLQQASDEGILPVVLATSRFMSDYIIESANRLGVGYLMSKPCELSAIIMRLHDLTQRTEVPLQNQSDPKGYVSGMLISLGFSTKLKGSPCLREAILCMAKDPGQSVTKEVYPAVARTMDGSAEQVERLVRSCIENAWKHRDPAVWERYFPEFRKRPTNLALISRLADCLNMKFLPK